MKKLLLIFIILLSISCANNHTHDYHEVERKESTCAKEGYITYQCKICEDIYSEALELKEHEYENGKCVHCNKRLLDAYIIKFITDDHAKIIVYQTNDFTKEGRKATYAFSKDEELGLALQNGNGDCVFTIEFEEGYILESFRLTSLDNVEKIMNPNDTKVTNGYKILNISADIIITIKSKKI